MIEVVENEAEKALKALRAKVLGNPKVVQAYDAFERACLEALEEVVKLEVAAVAPSFVLPLLSPAMDALTEKAADALNIAVPGAEAAPAAPVAQVVHTATPAPAPAAPSGPSLLDRIEQAIGIKPAAPSAPAKPAAPAKPVNTRFGMRPPGQS